VIDIGTLRQRQSLPLEAKVRLSMERIREWLDRWDGDAYVSFSGGKDSTVLLDLARRVDPSIPAVFADTGVEFPEVRSFVKTIPNVNWLRPKMPFASVVREHGFPVVSKNVARRLRDLQNPTERNAATRQLYLTGIRRDGQQSKISMLPICYRPLIQAPFKISEQCCDVLKKEPFHRYESETGRLPIIGTMAHESRDRERVYLMQGCNAFDAKRPKSAPLSIWTDQDVLRFIVDRHIPIASVYGDIVEGSDGLLKTTGERRTGCMFCLFGILREKGENRIQRMQRTHPRMHAYALGKLGLREVMEFMGVPHSTEPVEPAPQMDLFVAASVSA
jgi:3'-phosphoadenosine 5'-phosphosulfate sulfotransferase (PAPS reductase)/FAD synthetase